MSKTIKSENYIGVFQREKSGKWFYRTKQTKGGTPIFSQASGYDTELEAYQARLDFIFVEEYQENYNEIITPVLFKIVFEWFLRDNVDSASSREKYQALYDAQLIHWENKIIGEMRDSDIDLLLLRLSLKQRTVINKKGEAKVKRYSKSYVDSVRKLVKLIFEYAMEKAYIHENFTVYFTKKPYKLRLMSLFSGIGAPEQALKNMGIDYQLVNYCEIDKKASKAYSLLHNVPESKNLWDVQKMDTRQVRNYPAFDVLIFGFPCQDISGNGAGKGLTDKDGEKTRSGLFFDAMRLAASQAPKFIIVENVAAIAWKNHKEDFEIILQTMDKVGYNIYHQPLNSFDFDVPQNRPRYFWVLIRQDMNLAFQFPEPVPLKAKAKDWFFTEVADEYYITPEKVKKLKETQSYKPNFREDYISCMATKWGSLSHSQQTFVRDSKGVRCLSSEELMVFQGFKAKQGTMLRDNDFSKDMVGKLVGNSITVPVIQAIFKQLFEAI